MGEGGVAVQLQLLLLIKRAKLETRTLRSNCGLLLMSAHRWPNGRMAPFAPPIAVIITLPPDRWPAHYATHFPDFPISPLTPHSISSNRKL